MEELFPVVLILFALLAGAISPGPSFILVATTTLGSSRKHGIAASIGMGVGGVVLSILALAGLHAVLTNVPFLYGALKIFGGIYLAYLAIRIYRGANQSMSVDINPATDHHSLGRSFLISFITQISNPKAAIIYGGIFAALLPEKTPFSFYYILPPLVFIVETGWYLVVTLVLSTASSRAVYLRSKSLYDRLAAAAMAGLSIKLLSSAHFSR